MTISEPATTFLHKDWEEYARCYDSLLHLTPYSAMIEQVVRESLLYKEGTILDASCGTGNFEKKFLELQGEQRYAVTGVDTSKEMLARAVQKCVESPTFNFLEANLNNALPFPDESFSQVVSINTLYAVSSPEKTLKEFHRVLMQGGRILLVTPKYGYENGIILKEHCNSSLPDDFWKTAHANPEKEKELLCEAIKNEEVIKDMLTVAKCNRKIFFDSTFHFFQKKELELLLESNGFSIQESVDTYSQQALYIIATKN
jgi:ubiquinone/menaquinone biosynthesis C-methylase UbiE